MADYSTHADYMRSVSAEADARKGQIEEALRTAFRAFIEKRSTEVIVFSGMSVLDLARAIQAQPLVLKPLIASCNVAARAIERDLGIKNVDTYEPVLTSEQAAAIAGYMKPFLPDYLEVPALSTLDRVYFVDKEIRKGKGHWEKKIASALSKYHGQPFKKRKFSYRGDEFELDAACPTSGPIEIGVDVKRIEARRDIHKRCDEIVNKASKFKKVHKKAWFSAVVYYPFIDEHTNIQSLLRSPYVDAVMFASDDNTSIDNAVQHLIAQLKSRSRR